MNNRRNIDSRIVELKREIGKGFSSGVSKKSISEIIKEVDEKTIMPSIITRF
ncbi:hypothetical protein [Polaribacter sp. R77954]|uniref:hypothetical protein n=1 Tax=Polaribacter sp. R77954 TaxID=3093870 RepID=UPI0037C9DAF4